MICLSNKKKYLKDRRNGSKRKSMINPHGKYIILSTLEITTTQIALHQNKLPKIVFRISENEIVTSVLLYSNGVSYFSVCTSK